MALALSLPAWADEATLLIVDLNRNNHFDYVSAWDSKPGVIFNIDGTGLMQRTGWVAKGDGFLALDRNGNGVIDSGAELITSLAGLMRYDDNHDGVIDARDEIFAKLLIWQDLNQNGISEARELQTLKAWDITMITHSAALTDWLRFKLGVVRVSTRRAMIAAQSLTTP